MPIAEKIKQFLDRRRIIYDVRELPPFTSLSEAARLAQISAAALVKTTVLKDDVGLVLVVTPLTHGLNVDALSKLLHRRMELADEPPIKQAFSDCVPGFIPPFAEAYGVRTIVDEALAAYDELYLSGGDASHLIRVSGKDFFSLLNNAWLARDFSRPLAEFGVGAQLNLKQRIQSLKELPPMPEMARRIFALRADPSADANKLAKLVEMDPSLAAQVVRYARSPFFGYRGNVDSVHAAISRVLGFEMVMNLVLGIAAAQPFKMPALGPLGLNAFWRHATYSAALVQALGRELPSAVRPPAGLSYLAGLLHNVGHLLLGHLFKREFCVLNSAVSDHPLVPVTDQETALLGVQHGEMGAWLMESWNMPPQVIVAVREHHNEQYRGEHAVYAQLVLLADRMLKEHGIGDASSYALPADTLAALGLEELQAVMVMQRILEGCEELNALARTLAV